MKKEQPTSISFNLKTNILNIFNNEKIKKRRHQKLTKTKTQYEKKTEIQHDSCQHIKPQNSNNIKDTIYKYKFFDNSL